MWVFASFELSRAEAAGRASTTGIDPISSAATCRQRLLRRLFLTSARGGRRAVEGLPPYSA